jgi:hypothetical protein
MKPTLKASAGHSDIVIYKKLLKVPYTKETLRSVLSLLWKLIAKSVNPSHFEWQKVLVYPPKIPAGAGTNEHIIATLRQASELFPDQRIPAMPTEFSEVRSDRSVVQAQQVWAYLCLQLLAQLNSETGMFDS